MADPIKKRLYGASTDPIYEDDLESYVEALERARRGGIQDIASMNLKSFNNPLEALVSAFMSLSSKYGQIEEARATPTKKREPKSTVQPKPTTTQQSVAPAMPSPTVAQSFPAPKPSTEYSAPIGPQSKFLDRNDFIKRLYPFAAAHYGQTGIAPEAYIAMAANESNWGNAGGNSLFGIKGKGLISPTWEMVNGQRVNITDEFQTYPSLEDAFSGFDQFVQIGRYAPAWSKLRETGDWRGFLRDINRAGYATDPSWGASMGDLAGGHISNLISQLGLR